MVIAEQEWFYGFIQINEEKNIVFPSLYSRIYGSKQMGQNKGKVTMYDLGIFDGTHDAGAVLLENGRPIFASNEERYTGQKGAGGWPQFTIEDALNHLPHNAKCRVAFAGRVNPNPILRLWRKQQQRWKLDDGKYFSHKKGIATRLNSWIQHDSPFPYLRSDHWLTQSYVPLLRRKLSQQLQTRHHLNIETVSIEDHHKCHAAAGHFTSGWDQSLIIVADGVGDGIALSIWKAHQSQLTLLRTIPYPHSLGLLFASITGYLGYRPFRHEGKLVGLSARGDASKIPLKFPTTAPPLNGQLEIMLGQPLKVWLRQLDGQAPEDVAAWLQQGLTRSIDPLVRWWIAETGLKNIVLVGGIFANVELNRTLLKTGGKQYYIFPHMGDGGLAMGAAMLSVHRFQPWRSRPLTTLALGPDLKSTGLETMARRYGMEPVQITHSPEAELAERLAQGHLVARAVGRMEYGPRALGQRSILAPAINRSIHTELNTKLNRSETMPFAPILLIEDLDRWVIGAHFAQHALPWMTVNVKAKPELVRLCPGIVHVDDTLRPQVVSAKNNPGLYQLLHHYRQKTGFPALINTSFNMHEHPIVRTAEDAMNAAQQAKIDCLQLEQFVFEK
ncbi:MAG: carbamoyltransferase C-terminal domain-containing protein [Myxococcota bacterium]|nr:carbamoyltransferase C-terminal domain-containing protein [Myxococcota bacterium]